MLGRLYWVIYCLFIPNRGAGGGVEKDLCLFYTIHWTTSKKKSNAACHKKVMWFSIFRNLGHLVEIY